MLEAWRMICSLIGVRTLCSLILTLSLGCAGDVEQSSPSSNAPAAPTAAVNEAPASGTTLEPSAPPKVTSDVLRLDEPREGATISSNPVELSGSLRAFENHALLRLLNDRGVVIVQRPLVATGDAGTIAPFSTSIFLTRDPGRRLTFELTTTSAKDGSVTQQIRRETTSALPMTELAIHFAAPSATDCSVTKPLTLRVPKSRSVARLLVECLLAGPPSDSGLSNPFPQTAVRGITRHGETLIVDFDGAMANIGGSCKASAIRAALERTLGQIEGVRKVEIRANGSAESALQP
jgi:hypothetical protein